MLSLKDISFYYSREKYILNNINLEMNAGEIFAIIGSSGSGKSTLLNIISGLEFSKQGEIYLNGINITKTFPEKRGVGMVFQDYALFPHLKVEDNVAFGLKGAKHVVGSRNIKYTTREINARVDEMLALVRLDGFRKRYPHELSGGEQQRVAIARSLAASPKILLFDEPFSNLDTNLKSSVRMEIKSILKSTATTAIIVTHDMEDAVVLSDKIFMLKAGELIPR